VVECTSWVKFIAHQSTGQRTHNASEVRPNSSGRIRTWREEETRLQGKHLPSSRA
jgi:Tfp pilus assembly protein FimT